MEPLRSVVRAYCVKCGQVHDVTEGCPGPSYVRHPDPPPLGISVIVGLVIVALTGLAALGGVMYGLWRMGREFLRG